MCFLIFLGIELLTSTLSLNLYSELALVFKTKKSSIKIKFFAQTLMCQIIQLVGSNQSIHDL